MEELWEKYNSTRLAGDKKTANKLLSDFIKKLKREDNSVIENFVDDVCRKTLKDNQIISNNGEVVSNNEYRIQHPLFKEIILPVLAKEYLNDNPLYIKWIAQLEQFFYTDFSTTQKFLKQINIEEKYFDTLYFLKKSFSINPDQGTLELIVWRFAQVFDYYFHEVPWGVLIESDILNEELNEFKIYYNQLVDKEKWTEILSYWEKIAKYWEDYCKSRENYLGFEDYLDKIAPSETF